VEGSEKGGGLIKKRWRVDKKKVEG